MLPEGTFPLKLAVKDTKTSVTKTVSSSITVRNTLLSILGDSYASGEGFPPFRNPDGTIDWDEPACDRSRWSGFVRAALTLEQSDPRSNVTVVDVACSGGEILEQANNPAVSPNGGLLSPQKKIKQPSQQSNTGPGDYMPPQIDQLATIAAGQTYDAGLLSIGGNDAGLSPVIISCVRPTSCRWSSTGSRTPASPGSSNPRSRASPTVRTERRYRASWTSPTFRTSQFTCEPNGPSGRSVTWAGLLTLIGDMNLITPGDAGGYRCLTSDPDAPDPVQDNPELEEAVFNNLQALQQDYAKLAPCFGATGGRPTARPRNWSTGCRSPTSPRPNPFGTTRSGT
jgi:hypothetical protein